MCVTGVRGQDLTAGGPRDLKLTFRLHLVPYFAGRKLDRITPEDVTAYMRAKHRVLAPKTVANHLALLGGLFRFAIRRGW